MVIKQAALRQQNMLLVKVMTMGIRESVNELENAMSGIRGVDVSRSKVGKPGAEQAARLERVEGSARNLSDAVGRLQKSVDALQKEVSEFEKISGQKNVSDIIRRLSEMEIRIRESDKSREISDLKKTVEEIRGKGAGIQKGYQDETLRRLFEKNFLEMKSRMDVLQKYVEGKMSVMNGLIESKVKNFAISGKIGEIKEDDINRFIDEKLKKVMEKAGTAVSKDDMNRIAANLDGKIAELSRKTDSFKSDIENTIFNASKKMPRNEETGKCWTSQSVNADEMKMLSDRHGSKASGSVEKSLFSYVKKMSDENKKLFALNSDVEKIWKEMQNLRKYADDRIKIITDLSKSLQVWEARNLKVMEKEHQMDERLAAFPDLKLIESRIRKIERAIMELQRHFVSSQAMNPVILE